MKIYYECIQGDTFELIVTPKRDVDKIEEIWFTCHNLALKFQAIKISTTEWIIQILDTTKMPVGSYTFDITLKLNDSKTFTSVYNGFLTILEKENRL